MALVSTRTYDWQDLADDSVTWGDTNSWVQWTGNGTTINGSTGFDDLVYTDTVFDFGGVRLFYGLVTVEAIGTVTIKYLISDDNVTYTEVTPNAHSARYVKIKITVVNASATAELLSSNAEYYFDPMTELFEDLIISSSGTTLPIARNFGLITNISSTTIKNIQVVLTDDTPTAPIVTPYDMDTWGRVATATTASIMLSGLPATTTDSLGNIVVA